MRKPRIRARYKTVGPKLCKVPVNFANIDASGSLQQEVKVVEKLMWMVYFPQEHSIRIDKAELIRMGYHLKPRLVDMDTGDVIDFGGDPYDLEEEIPDRDIELHEEDDELNIEQPAPKVAKGK